MGRSRRRIAGLNEEQVMHAMGIDDAYRVERVLARGAGGVTERVTIEGAGPFIRKKIPTERANRGVWAAIASSPCPRLPQIAATYEMPDCFVAVYDDIPGDTLEHALYTRGHLTPEDATQVLLDVCEAVAALHGCGVIHLDISPENVIVAADGAHVIDFGNARLLDQGATLGNGTTGKPLGTWGFAAPEQYGFAVPDARSDVYAMGRLLGYLLTGVRPDQDASDAYQAALMDAERVPAGLRSIIERASAFEPSARYQRVEDMAAALENIERQIDKGRMGAPMPPAGVPATAGASTGSGTGSDSHVTKARSGGANVQHGTTRRVVAIAAFVLALVAVVAGGAVAFNSGALFGSPEDSDVDNSSGDDRLGDEPMDDAGADKEPGSDASSVSSGSTTDVSDGMLQRAYESLELVETGWGTDVNGYVHYGMTFRNASDDIIIDFPEIQITGRAEDGSIVFSDSHVMGPIFPGETTTFASQAGNRTKPATVDFSFARPAEYAVRAGTGEAATFEVRGLRATQDSRGGVSFTGEVKVVDDGDEVSGEGLFGSQLKVSVILRDESGAIVYGESTFVTRPAQGETVPFEVSIHKAPSYATAEVYPIAW